MAYWCGSCGGGPATPGERIMVVKDSGFIYRPGEYSVNPRQVYVKKPVVFKDPVAEAISSAWQCCPGDKWLPKLLAKRLRQTEEDLSIACALEDIDSLEVLRFQKR